jgi:transposase
LFFLPPYSPQLNPDELVWNDVKNNVVGRLRFLQKRPDRVRSFFRSPDTRYAAA